MDTVRLGDRIWWSDPDEELGSGAGTVVSLQHSPPYPDSVIVIELDSGSVAEVLRNELSPLRESPAANQVGDALERLN